MGPISMDWFRQNGLTETVTHTVKNKQQRDILRNSRPDIEVGDTFEREEVAVSYSGGRIDIRDDTKEGYDGWHEYSLALMRTEDWNHFSDWLDDFETEELWSLIDILEKYRQDTGHVIRWWKDDEWLKVLEEWKNT
jgi:hypothetical protein